MNTNAITAGDRATISDIAEGRAALIDQLRRRWIGPYGGDDEILHRNPVYAYLVGTLYPVEARTAAALRPHNAESIEAYSLDDEAEFLTEENEDWEGMLAAEGMAAGDADEDLGPNLQGAFGWAPHSLGMSFLHSGTTLRVKASAGIYRTLSGSGGVDETGGEPAVQEGDERRRRKAERWMREPISTGDEFITIGTTGSRLVFDGRAELYWRTRNHFGKFLTTVALKNTHTVDGNPKGHPDKCLFQVQLECEDETGILPYPQSGVHASEEDREIAFRYRDKPSYAVGHGTAVEWAPSTSPTKVVTETIPQVETHPIRARSGAGKAVQMRWLSDETVTEEELVAELRGVADDYAIWIATQRADADAEGRQDQDVANAIVARHDETLRRMYEGIEVLRADALVRKAFRLANTAMRWQMLRARGEAEGGVAADARYGTKLFADREGNEPMWRPFQLGFILASLASAVDSHHQDRDLVDLIWFPTGGGKTEAYLGLAALEMIRRRLVDPIKGGGTAVLTRYTMRLLTAQQFQRAATLICALELMRDDDEALDGVAPFSIGLWLGNSTTPGTYKDAATQFHRLREESRPENPFQLLVCPWCSHRIIPKQRTMKDEAYGVVATPNMFKFFCPDGDCPFAEEIPVQVVDEGIYDNAPTMLVATVDKLARLAWIDKGAKLFGAVGVHEPPSLVIQDELHLLSGPLGTIVGVYESAISALLAWRGKAPKVVASTATTRASNAQIRELMGKRVAIFPPPGLNADDNYFSEPDSNPDVIGRTYLGIMPQAHSPSWAIGQLSTELLDAPVAAGLSGEVLDAYWSLVVYHNSLRELGRTVTILRDDVPLNLKSRSDKGEFVRQVGAEGVEELNGNVSSAALTQLLSRLKTPVGTAGAIDALATTNIMSVGIDVSRLGLMLVNGYTKTTSEYIQATSRVGRGKVPGVVVTMFRSSKPRDRSVYESFGAYHRTFFRYVEPSSVSPWSLQARRRALRAALVILVRHGAGLSANSEAAKFDPQSFDVKKAISMLKDYVGVADPDQADAVAREIDSAVADWVLRRQEAVAAETELVYQSRSGESLLRQFTEPGQGWPVMNSMRNVDRVVKVRANGERGGK